MATGVALSSMPRGERSLDFLEPLKDSLSYLVVTDWNCSDLSVLEHFDKLTYLDIQRTVPCREVDLSGLTLLKEYAGPGGPECRSVLSVASLESVYLDQSSDDDLLRIEGCIRELRLERASGHSSVPAVAGLRDLRSLWVTDADRFNMSTLAGMRDLEVVRIWDCQSLTGIAALAACPSLREVSIDGVGVLEDWAAVLSLDFPEVSLTDVKSLPADAASLIPQGRNNWTFTNKG